MENNDDSDEQWNEISKDLGIEGTPDESKSNNRVIEEKEIETVQSDSKYGDKEPESQASPDPVYQEPKKRLTAMEWFAEMGWHGNPFTFSIIPELFVGYRDQLDRIIMALEERHKFVYLAGPTGSGKTTLLKAINAKFSKEFDILYIAKPPERADQFIDIINEKYRKSWFEFWKSNIKNIYQVPQFMNEKLKSRHLIVLFDEAHESRLEVLEWLRVLSDQVNNMSVVLSGLPVFETHLKDNLETFRKRIAAKIELVSLTKEETRSLIVKRIRHIGGTGDEFSPQLIDFIFAQSGGFPREILRVCDELVNSAILSGTKEFAFSPVVQQEMAAQVSLNIVDEMTPMQREIIELLAKNPMSPGAIANTISLEKYKSRQHAVRSINNIMKKLYEDGYLERRRSDKAYIYSLSGKLRTIVVKR